MLVNLSMVLWIVLWKTERSTDARLSRHQIQTMLSALITVFRPGLGEPSPEAVIRTLGSIVPAAVAGLIADVALIGPADGGDLNAIADHAGCRLLQGESEGDLLRRALAACRRDRVLVVVAGYAPGPGFLEEAADRVGPAARPFRAIALCERPKSVFGFIARRRIVGVMARTDTLLSLRFSSFDRLASQARPDQRLKCGALRVG